MDSSPPRRFHISSHCSPSDLLLLVFWCLQSEVLLPIFVATFKVMLFYGVSTALTETALRVFRVLVIWISSSL